MNSLYWQTALLLAGAYLTGAILSCLVRKLFPSDRRSDYDAGRTTSAAAAPSAGSIAPSPALSAQSGATLAPHDRAGEEIVTISHGRERAQETSGTSFGASAGQVVEPPAQRASLSGAQITKRSASLSTEIAASERAKRFERSLSGQSTSPATLDTPVAPTPSVSADVAAPAPTSAAGGDLGQVSEETRVSGDRVVTVAAATGAAALAAAAASAATGAATADQEPQEAVVAKLETAAKIDVAAIPQKAAAVPATDAVVPIAPVPAAAAPVAVVPEAVAPAAVEVPSAAVAPDDLKNIRTIDAGIEQELNENGITRYSEIAGWTSSDVGHANAALGTTGRVQKENWIEQAQILSTGGSTAYSRRRQLQSAGQTGETVPAPTIPTAAAAAASPEHLAPAAANAIASPDPVASMTPSADAPTEPVPAATAAPAVASSTATTAVPVVGGAAAPQPPAAAPEIADTSAAASTRADERIAETQPSSLAATAAKAAAAVAGAAALARSAQGAPAQESRATETSAATSAAPAAPDAASPVQVSIDAAAKPTGTKSAPARPDSTDSAQVTINPVAAAAAAATAATVAAVTGSQQPTTTARDSQPQPQIDTQSRADRDPWPEREARPEHEPRQPRPERDPRPSLQGMRSVRSEAYKGNATSGSGISSTRVLSSDYDDLKRVRGIGVMIERRLNALGITSYEQMANWSADDVAKISQALDFKGRIERENWIEQARILDAGGYTEFSSRVDRGEVDSSKNRR